MILLRAPFAVKGKFMYVSNRKAFAMILAIFVLVLVAMGGVLILGNASINSKSIGDNYVHAQAELLADSATEYAVMRAQGFDTTTGNCLNTLDITVQDASGASAYSITVNYQYSFKGAKPNNQCSLLAENTGNATMVLVDVTVTGNASITTEQIRVHKRSWQKL